MAPVEATVTHVVGATPSLNAQQSSPSVALAQPAQVVQEKSAHTVNPLITDSGLDIDDSDDYLEEEGERKPRIRSVWFILALLAVMILQMLIVSFFVNAGFLG